MRIDPARTAVAMTVSTALGDQVQGALELTRSTSPGVEPVTGGIRTRGRYLTWSGRADLSGDLGFGLVEGRVYHNHMAYKPQDGASDAIPGAGDPVFDNDVTVVQVNSQFKPGADHALRPALEYRHNRMDSAPEPGGSVGYHVIAASLMWNWQITQRLSATLSGRLDHMELERSGRLDPRTGLSNRDWDRSLEEVSGNAGLVYRATDRDTFRLTAGRSIQAPTLVELGFQSIETVQGFSVVTTGNPQIDPTKVTSVEIGWDRRIDSLSSRLRLSAFHQVTRDIKEAGEEPLLRPDQPILVFSFQNIGDSTASGIEVGLAGSAADWRWSGSYAYTLIDDDPNGSTDMGSARGTPRHTVGIGLGRTIGRWDVDASAHYVSRLFQTGLSAAGGEDALVDVKVPDHVVLDLRAAYRLNDRITLALHGHSLADGRTREDGGPGVQRQIRATIGVDF